MKDFAVGFYNTKRWQAVRKAYVKSVDGLCEDCLAKGIYKPGEIVHHIIQLTPQNINNPEITTGFDNLRLVCRECHAAEHGARGNRRFTIDENGKVVTNA